MDKRSKRRVSCPWPRGLLALLVWLTVVACSYDFGLPPGGVEPEIDAGGSGGTDDDAGQGGSDVAGNGGTAGSSGGNGGAAGGFVDAGDASDVASDVADGALDGALDSDGFTGPGCGNGRVEPPDEECDDGNSTPDDGCSPACEVQCPFGQKDPGNFHCYEVVTVGRTWAEAKLDCEGLGGHLATLTSTYEDGIVMALLSADAWIGATDGLGLEDPQSGVYSWVTGEPWSFAHWGNNQPDTWSGDCGTFPVCYEHCAAIRVPELDWNDAFCNLNLEYVCEWDPPGWE